MKDPQNKSGEMLSPKLIISLYFFTTWEDIICLKFYLNGTFFYSFFRRPYNAFYSQGAALLLFKNIVNIET